MENEKSFSGRKTNSFLPSAHNVVKASQPDTSTSSLTFKTLVTGFPKHFCSKPRFPRWPGMAEPRRFREMSTCVMSHRPGKGVTEEESDGHTKAYSYSFGRVKAKTALNKLIKAVNLRPVRVHNVNLQITTGCLNL